MERLDRVVHAKAQPQERCEIQDEDAHRRERGDEEHDCQGDDHRGAADRECHAGSNHRAEHEQERQSGQRKGDQLGAAEIRFGESLDVAVEGRAAGQRDFESGRRSQCSSDEWQALRGVVRREVELDDVVGRVTIGRDLARRQHV